jgi:hypothetical protein
MVNDGEGATIVERPYDVFLVRFGPGGLVHEADDSARVQR